MSRAGGIELYLQPACSFGCFSRIPGASVHSQLPNSVPAGIFKVTLSEPRAQKYSAALQAAHAFENVTKSIKPGATDWRISAEPQ
jgi:hypothetical protein